MSACVYIAHEDNNNTIQVYSGTTMTHVIAFDAGQSSQVTFVHRHVTGGYKHHAGEIRTRSEMREYYEKLPRIINI